MRRLQQLQLRKMSKQLAIPIGEGWLFCCALSPSNELNTVAFVMTSTSGDGSPPAQNVASRKATCTSPEAPSQAGVPDKPDGAFGYTPSTAATPAQAYSAAKETPRGARVSAIGAEVLDAKLIPSLTVDWLGDWEDDSTP